MSGNGEWVAALEDVVAAECARLALPGAVVGVRRAGEERYVTHGVTNVEHPLPTDEHTCFQVASISKTFTATAVTALVQSGRVALEAPVATFLEDLTLPAGVERDAVTVEHLLNHRSGVLGDGLFAAPGTDTSLDSVPRRVGEQPQPFPPGADWSYNNLGFSLAGALVARVTGEPFAEALRTLVLEPAGMDRVFTTADEVVTHRVAAPHITLGDASYVLRNAGWQRGWQLQDLDVPAGGVVTDAASLLRWAAVHTGAVPGPLDAGHRDLMQQRRAGAGGDISAMGLGWWHQDPGGVATFGHDGMTVGYHSRLRIVPSADLAFVVLTNGMQGNRLTRSVTAHLLTSLAGAGPVRPEVPVDPPVDATAEIVGTYDDPFYLLHLDPADVPGRAFLRLEQRPPDPGRWTPPALGDPTPLAWIGPDRWMTLEPDGGGDIVDIGRDAAGAVVWARSGLRICARLDEGDSA